MNQSPASIISLHGVFHRRESVWLYNYHCDLGLGTTVDVKVPTLLANLSAPWLSDNVQTVVAAAPTALWWQVCGQGECVFWAVYSHSCVTYTMSSNTPTGALLQFSNRC